MTKNKTDNNKRNYITSMYSNDLKSFTVTLSEKNEMLKTQDKSLTKVDNSRGSARSASFPRSNSRSNESSDFSINRFVMLTPGFCISETD